VPYAGTHRLIDFPLSNCHNAGLPDVWIAQQFNPISLSDHLANGRPWDLDRTIGGLLILQPRLGHGDRGGFQRGTADALWRNAPLIRDYAPEALVVVSADAVYACDYGALVDEHMSGDAAVTMVTTEVDPDDAGRYGVVSVRDGAVVDYAYKPDDPAGSLVANEVFVFRPEPLLDTLEQLADEAGEDELEDLGHGLLPRLVDSGAARESRFEGYWRDVGTVDAYWESHMDLLGDEPPIDLDDPDWPVLTHAAVLRASARVDGAVEGSLVAPAARVAGSVSRSVLGRGVVVEEGAVVSESVLLPGAVVRSGARVERAVIDEGVVVERDVAVGEAGGEIALVGLRASVSAAVPGGGRFPVVEDD
jgi:glucose-1-phosphate adenylyltransferase